MKKNIILSLTALVSLCVSCNKAPLTDSTTGGLSKNKNNSMLTPLISAPGDVVGKVIVGYQGWFACVGDGAPDNSWSHWSSNSALPGPANVTIKAWPDVRDYTATYQTGFASLGNGQPSKLYSPWDQQTVTAQFQSMQRAGIDGAALQRLLPGPLPAAVERPRWMA
jgi:hypothetical protein